MAILRRRQTTWSDILSNPTSNTTSTTVSWVIYASFEIGWGGRGGVHQYCRSATTNPATLTVPPPSAPTIITQPGNQTFNPGQNASLTATASADPTATAQWQISLDGGTTWSDLFGPTTENTTTLSGSVYATSENGWGLPAVFTNGLGSPTTTAATPAVDLPPEQFGT